MARIIITLGTNISMPTTTSYHLARQSAFIATNSKAKNNLCNTLFQNI
jgi:hypothetical protein